MDSLTNTGNLGDPTVATREKGDEMVADAVANVTELVRALDGLDAPEGSDA
ncbi:hypothetical protein [Halorubrum sp. 48-1-W]|uniref:hypothetical protein n=1 Tax=Halorubrum sp. 48-1-W TaxID=2249761 RepID=UPI0018E5A7A9|nr:hypothetical protein [Halorubrum sp. 48-1-W]